MKKSDLTKERILNAAEMEFAEKGLYGARIDEIALKANANKRMIYSYFGNKEELYTIVLDKVYKELGTAEEKLLSQELSPADAIENTIYMYFEFLYSHPNFVKLVMWENLNEAKYIELSEVPIIKDTAFKMLKNIIKKGMVEGAFKSEIDIDEIAFSLNMFCFSYFSNIHTMSRLMKIDFEKKEQMLKRADHVAELIMQHILK